MTLFIVKQSDEPILGLPGDLLQEMKLKEGDQVSVQVLRRPTQEAIEAFRALEGIFADDPAFEEAMRELEQGWAEWDRQLNDLYSTPDS